MQSTRDEEKTRTRASAGKISNTKRRTQTQRTDRNSSTTRTDLLIIVVHTLLYPQNSRTPTPARPTSASRTSPVSADLVDVSVPPYSHTSVQPAVDTPSAVTVIDIAAEVVAAAVAYTVVAGTVVAGTVVVARTDTPGDSKYCSQDNPAQELSVGEAVDRQVARARSPTQTPLVHVACTDCIPVHEEVRERARPSVRWRRSHELISRGRGRLRPRTR